MTSRMNLTGIGLIATLLQTGCMTVLFPPHSNSHDVKGETTEIRLLAVDESEALLEKFSADAKIIIEQGRSLLKEKNIALDGLSEFDIDDLAREKLPSDAKSKLQLQPHDWRIARAYTQYKEATTHARTGEAKAAPLVAAMLAPIAAAAVKYGMDWAASQLRSEAAEYEAQYGLEIAGDDFWQTAETKKEGEQPPKNEEKDPAQPEQVAKRKPRYWGFELLRLTKSCPTQDTPAAQFILGWPSSHDEQMMKVVPIYSWIASAKAKVLSDEGWSWYTVLWKPFLRPGHELDVDVDVTITGIWRDAQQKVHTDLLAAVSIPLTAYDLDNTRQLQFVKDARFAREFGWFPGVPVSQSMDKPPVLGFGTFLLKVHATERDRSNVRKNLERAAKAITDNEDKLAEKVAEKIKELGK